jgi:hypothetical protein
MFGLARTIDTAFSVWILNNVGRVGRYVLRMIIRVATTIIHTILLSKGVFTTEYHQASQLALWIVIKLIVSETSTSLAGFKKCPGIPPETTLVPHLMAKETRYEQWQHNGFLQHKAKGFLPGHLHNHWITAVRYYWIYHLCNYFWRHIHTFKYLESKYLEHIQ